MCLEEVRRREWSGVGGTKHIKPVFRCFNENEVAKEGLPIPHYNQSC